VLFYGPAGTGKTSYAREILSQLGQPAYEIRREVDNHSRNRRIALVAALGYCSCGEGGVILIGKADNILSTKSSFFGAERLRTRAG
jgi:replication-associated recombination protein RarA